MTETELNAQMNQAALISANPLSSRLYDIEGEHVFLASMTWVRPMWRRNGMRPAMA